MDRRDKQQAFQTRQMARSILPKNIVSDRPLTVYTWGMHRHTTPPEVDHVYNVTDIRLDENLSFSKSGCDEDYRTYIVSLPPFKRALGDIVRGIETNNWRSIGVCCHHGQHRSVALAETLKEHYSQVDIHHLSLRDFM